MPSTGSPVVNPLANQTVAENAMLTLTPVGSDPDGDPLTWFGANLPSGSSVNASTGVFTWTPTSAQRGVYADIILAASDGHGGTGSAACAITVPDVNSPVVVQPIANQSVIENHLLTVTPSGADAYGEALTWNGASLPSGASVNASTGTFTCTPNVGQAGTYANVTLIASDGFSGPFPTGTGPKSVAMGDLNGDGRPELMTANQSSGTASILLNTGAMTDAHVPPVPTQSYELSLGVGHPNPSRGGLAIHFTLPQPAQTTLRVFDASSHLVATLADGMLAEGPHTARWERRTLRGQQAVQGVYFCELRAGNRRLVNRLVILE